MKRGDMYGDIGYRVVDNIKALHAYSKGDILKYEDELNHAILAGKKISKNINFRGKGGLL